MGWLLYFWLQIAIFIDLVGGYPHGFPMSLPEIERSDAEALLPALLQKINIAVCPHIPRRHRPEENVPKGAHLFHHVPSTIVAWIIDF